MTINFPALRPSDRFFKKGLFPVDRQLAPAGTGTTRRFGIVPVDVVMSLEFAHIPDASADLIASTYTAAAGAFNAVVLPDELWDDIESELQENLRYNYAVSYTHLTLPTKA